MRAADLFSLSFSALTHHPGRSLLSALGIAVDRVSVKGKTNEGVDAVGCGDAIATHAVALLHRVAR